MFIGFGSSRKRSAESNLLFGPISEKKKAERFVHGAFPHMENVTR